MISSLISIVLHLNWRKRRLSKGLMIEIVCLDQLLIVLVLVLRYIRRCYLLSLAETTAAVVLRSLIWSLRLLTLLIDSTLTSSIISCVGYK